MKKKGFTLIELLAVIIILAIIALIAVPVIMNIIGKANKSAFKDSAYGIIKAGELYYAEQQLTSNGMTEDKIFTFPEATGLELKGSKPTSGSMKITKNGDIVLAISNGKYCVKKGLNEAEVTIDENIEECKLPASSTDKTLSSLAITSTELGVNEVNACATSGICENGTAFAIKVNDTETYKFYVIADDGNEATLIMNKNLGSKVAWMNEEDYTKAGGTEWTTWGDIKKGPLTALKALEERTNGWTNIAMYDYILENDPYEYDYVYDTYQPINRTGVRARMITSTEAANLGCGSWNPNTCPAYLYENLSEGNTEEQPKGYWTSLGHWSTSCYGGVVHYDGGMNGYSTNVITDIGVRPVIKISKN